MGLGVFLLFVLFASFYTYTRTILTDTIYAQSADTVNFQARLLTSGGSIASDGNYSVEFRLYEDETGGTSIWGEQQTVSVKSGYLSVYLGSVVTIPSTIDWSQQHWLTMNVNADGEMIPRIRLTAVPFAFQADRANGLINGVDVLQANDLLQTAPTTIQSINSSVAGLRFNQSGTGGLIELQGDGANSFTVNKTGDGFFRGILDVSGASVRIGAASQQGSLILNDGSGNTLTLRPGAQSSNLTFTLPGADGLSGECLQTDGSGILSFGSCGGGGTNTAFELGGNSFGALAQLGTTDNFGLAFITNNTEQVRITNTGDVGIGRTVPLERLDVNGGIRLGNSAGTNAGTLRWNGVDFEGYNGTEWISLSAGGGLSALSLGMIHVYESTASVNVSGGWTDLTFNTQARVDSQFSHTISAAPVTIEEAGWYEITYYVSTDSAGGGNTNATAQARLVEDTGGGFTEIPGSIGSMLHRSGGDSGSNAAVTVLREFQVGNQIKLQAQQSVGGLTITTVPGGVGMTIRNITDAGAGGGGGTGLEFTQGGNSFSTKAILGTTDNEGLDVITNNQVALAIDANGLAAFSEALTIQSGGIDVTGNSVIDGLLSGLTGLTVASGGINVSGSGISNTGSITGVGNSISAVNGLTISSGNANNLVLESASGLLSLSASTWQRTASGITTISLNDSLDTTLRLENSDASAVADLSVEGVIDAQSFNGNGSGLTSLNASSLNTGTVSDGLLSSNIARLSGVQTFSGLTTFSNGLVVGNTASATAGAIRWNGADFEGYDGSQWISLTSPSSAPLLEGVVAFGKVDGSGTALNIDGATVVRNSIGDYTVTFLQPVSNPDYTVSLSLEDTATFNDPNIVIANQTVSSFDVYIGIGDNGGAADARADRVWHFIVLDGNAVSGGGGSAGTGLEFVQGGNAFGSTALLGTTDNQGLDFITNATLAASIDAAGDAVFYNSVTLQGALEAQGSASFSGGLVSIGAPTVAGVVALSDGSSNTGAIQATSLSANRTYTLPDLDGEICLSSGNCGGGGNFVEIDGNTTSGILVIGTNTAQSFAIETNNTNRLTVDTSGNVNLLTGGLQTLGTTRLSSSGALQNITGLTVISGGANITGGIVAADGITISGGGLTVTGNSSISGTLTTSGALTVSGGGATINGGIDNTSGGITNAGAVSGVTSLSASGDINTTLGNIQTNSVTRITNAGALQNISTITTTGNINTGGVFQVGGISGVSGSCIGGNTAYLNNITVTGGIITAADCRSSGASLSDARLKENVVSLDASVLDSISLVNTVEFDFKCEDPAYAEMNLSCQRQTGVIAQELAEVFPSLVEEGEDGFLRVKYDALNIYTLRAVSELARVIDSNGRVNATEVMTDSTMRLTQDGQLTNINGLSLLSGGASIVGGIDNNDGGLTNVGSVEGVSNLGANTILLRGGQADTDALTIQKDGVTVAAFASNGALRFMANDDRALAVANRSGQDMFRVDTQNGLVFIGDAKAAAPVLFVLSGSTSVEDPEGVDGAQYYNVARQSFRCYEDGRWKDCISKAATDYLLAASTVNHQQGVERKEVEGIPQLFVDLTHSWEVSFQMSASSNNSSSDLRCELEYLAEGATEWAALSETVPIGEDGGAARSAWSDLPDAARVDSVQVRVVCDSGSQSMIRIESARMQIR